jgi:hypothetical protein
MAGMVSEGMLLDIGYSEGITPVLAVPESGVPDGAERGEEHGVDMKRTSLSWSGFRSNATLTA